jgi:hypothetical protein
MPKIQEKAHEGANQKLYTRTLSFFQIQPVQPGIKYCKYCILSRKFKISAEFFHNVEVFLKYT